MAVLTVVRSGPLTTVQDLGRPGLAHLGVPRSGAVDLPALRRANRLVGNDDGAAALECTLLGPTLRADRPVRMAVTGAVAPVTVDGAEAPAGAAFDVPAGGVVRIGPARSGVRCYLAVAGGIAVDPVLGSRSTDTLSGIGPAALRDGDMVPLGPRAADPVAGGCAAAVPDATTGTAPFEAAAAATGGAPAPLVWLHPGPRVDWFTDAAVARLFTGAYRVSPTSNRIGLRLAGPALERQVRDELPSEGLVLGAMQVPAGGEPLVFLADHPTTGGYPVVAVADPDDIPTLAQARPGTAIRFRAAGDWV